MQTYEFENELDDTEDTEHAARACRCRLAQHLGQRGGQPGAVHRADRGGVWAKSQSLIADGIHSLSDLVAGFCGAVCQPPLAKRRGRRPPYGHQRFETAASLVLGLLLLAVGVGMVWSAVVKLENPNPCPRCTRWRCGWPGALVGKELLFRYMLAVAKRSSRACWWPMRHARSDAASSLVVGVGIAGNLAGYPILDPIAALIVGFMVGKMGWEFGWDAMRPDGSRGG